MFSVSVFVCIMSEVVFYLVNWVSGFLLYGISWEVYIWWWHMLYWNDAYVIEFCCSSGEICVRLVVFVFLASTHYFVFYLVLFVSGIWYPLYFLNYSSDDDICYIEMMCIWYGFNLAIVNYVSGLWFLFYWRKINILYFT